MAQQNLGALEKVLRVGEGRRLKRLADQAEYILSLEPDFHDLSDAELAAAARGALEPPFRLEAVRRDGDRWALGLRRIEVVQLPALEGRHLVLTVVGAERTLALDGVAAAPVALPALERNGDYVAEGARLTDGLWEVVVTPL